MINENVSTALNLRSDSKARAKEASVILGRAELLESKGHFFWSLVLCIDIFFLPYIVSFFGLADWGLVYFVVGLGVLLGNFIIHVLVMRDRHFNFPTAEAIPSTGLNTTEPELWTLLTFRYRMRILLREFLRLEFFGWIVFLSGGLGAVNQAIKASMASTAATYLDVMDRAAYDLTRAAIIGVIVLFFAQVMRQHRVAIDRTNQAAEQALTAAAMARRAISDAETALPSLETAIEQGVGFVKHAFRDLKRLQTVEQIWETVKAIPAEEPRKLFGEIADLIDDNLFSTYEELKSLKSSTNDAAVDTVEATCFYSLYIAYLTSESLAFVGKDSSGQIVERGRGSCELATRFVNYSIAVRKIVETLEKIEPGRFEYYTIFVGKPSRFFNIENGGADPEWSVAFLDFCERHERDNIPYQRVFVSNESSSEGENARLFKTEHIKRDLKSALICWSDTGRPVLWNSVGLDRPLNEIQVNALSDIARDYGVEDPGFIIKSNNMDRGLLSSELPPLPRDFKWETIGDTLARYHNLKLEPKVLEFFSLKYYIDVFGDAAEIRPHIETLLPRDLFAVRDRRDSLNGGWRLCLGTLTPTDYGAVRLMFATQKRLGMRRGTWEELTRKLTLVFLSPDKETQFFRQKLLNSL